LRVTVSTADAALANGDAVYIETRIEGLRVADLAHGTALAKPFTLQFGVKAPAGTYSVTFLNSAANRSYVATYTISSGAANTTVVKSVTVPGDVTGTWLTSNGIGIAIRWGLMVGASFAQVAGSWSTGNALGAPGQFNFMGTIGNVFELFDVGLYEGSAAPPFQVPDYTSELQACLRYFQIKRADASAVTYLGAFQSYASTGGLGLLWALPVTMRVAPTPSVSAFGDISLFDAGTSARACTSMTLTATASSIGINAIIETTSFTPPQVTTAILNAGSGWIKANARM
jgi:hypothetical protein